MPIVPEKLNSRQEIRNAISSQFWDQTVHSARSLDGTGRTLACEPPPVGQTAASGLLRSQELLTTQAAGVPVMPGYCKQHGGVVSYLITGSVCAVDVSLSTICGHGWLSLAQAVYATPLLHMQYVGEAMYWIKTPSDFHRCWTGSWPKLEEDNGGQICLAELKPSRFGLHTRMELKWYVVQSAVEQELFLQLLAQPACWLTG